MDVCSAIKLFVLIVCMEVVCCQLPSEQLVSSQLPFDQVSTMTSIYEIIENNTGSSFVWANDLKDSSPCSWRGVVCSNDNSSITSLSLRSFSVSTSDFLPLICNISTLEYIDVSHNQLSSIPDGFYNACGGISGLKILNFSMNGLSGSLPSFSGFTVLERLDFSRNNLSGEISLQFDGLGSLKSLDLSRNWFTGKIPTNLGKMNVLEELVLSANSFTGEIPLEITKFKNLSVIDLSANMLSGSIPGELGELTSLQFLVLSSNQLSGGIPTSLTNITTLQRFAANQNKFNGTIPSRISSYLVSLDLSYNELRGTIPSDLLSGRNLQALDLTSNKLEGPIPAITSTKLFRLRLGSNSLNGTIPSYSMASLVELKYLELNDNSLSGEIPLELGMCKKLALLDLAKNEFVGSLPPVLGDLTNLEFLSLELNNFVGAIPQELSQLTKLGKVKMNGNSLNGSNSSWVSNLSSLIELQLGSNQLSGHIPDLPISLEIALNLSYNRFSGPIPVSLTKLERLTVLDLSNNRLSGYVPKEMNRLQSLTFLLLSNNELSGTIPKIPRIWIDPGNPTENPSPVPKTKKKLVHSDFLIAAGTGFPVGVLIWIIAIFISRRYHTIHGILSTPNAIHKPIIHFNKAMQALSHPSNITVKATFSTFYKAVMPSGTTYLVKRFNHTNQIFQFPRHKELVEELEVLGELSHPNVMIPVAYLLTTRRAYLFYDFVRGTLYDILHHRMGCRLDWPSRFTIAVGVSKGLTFLHECTSGPIILLDLCSKSILLKSMDVPQISDIELCSLIHPSKTRESMASLEASSIGYVPPEYGSTKRVTAAGNVYSFGVVLLELVTGKPAVSEGSELAKWVLSISEQGDRWDEIVDSSVSETSVGVRNQMVAVVKVGLACINTSPEMRPNSATVLQNRL